MSWFGLLASQRCAVCPVASGLLGDSSKVVSYCRSEHQSTHRSKQKASCTAIKNTRETLAREEAALQNSPIDAFNSAVGNFWGIYRIRDYMRTRFATANALLQVKPMSAAAKAFFGFTFGGYTTPDRPVGNLVKPKIQTLSPDNISRTVKALKSQYHQLCQVVNDANPYFWDALLDQGAGDPAIPDSYTIGLPAETQTTCQWCKQAWEKSEDGLVMIEADTCSFVQVYTGPTSSSPVTRMSSAKPRRGFHRVFPSKFEPPAPNATPSACFTATRIRGGKTVRFVFNTDPKKLLLYTDGACADNGRWNSQGGWAVVYGPTDSASSRLEDTGPLGYDSPATSNRAELYAAIAALQVRDWKQEGFDSIVIATDSTYVADGATTWAKTWVRNGWKTADGCDVKNQDLWEPLLGEVGRWAARAFQVYFWKIPRKLNRHADKLAKAAANIERPRRGSPISRSRLPTQSLATVTGRAKEANPRVSALSLKCEDTLDGVHGSPDTQITCKGTMERATTAKVALGILREQRRPGFYEREAVKVRRQAVGNRRLPEAYSQKALFCRPLR